MNLTLQKPQATAFALPSLIERSGERATSRFVEFFTATIRNPNTRAAYAQACTRFLDAMAAHNLSLERIEPVHVAIYVERLTQERAAPTVKQHLAAIRQLLDHLVTGQVLPFNPAASVKAPKHVTREGKTPILQAAELRKLFASFDNDKLIDVRDRAMIAVMSYSFARVTAVTKLRVRDYYRQGAQAWFLLKEKGGRENKVPVHHQAAHYVERYLELAGIASQRESPLFRSVRGRTGVLTDSAMLRSNVFVMIRRRVLAVGLPIEIGCHSFRGSGITNYLSHGGSIETAARIAGHASTSTTQLYDRRSDTVNQSEIERIRF